MKRMHTSNKLLSTSFAACIFSSVYHYWQKNQCKIDGSKIKFRCRCEPPGYQRLGDRCVNPFIESCTTNCSVGSECRGFRCYQKCSDANLNCPSGLTCVNGKIYTLAVMSFEPRTKVDFVTQLLNKYLFYKSSMLLLNYCRWAHRVATKLITLLCE